MGVCVWGGVYGGNRECQEVDKLTCVLASLNESRAVVERNLFLPEVLTCPPWNPATGQAELVRLRPGTHLKVTNLVESHS